MSDRETGRVYLVGAGPGDPGLITVRGAAKLAVAEVVVYDTLVNPALLDIAPPEALRIDVGKQAGRVGYPQETITALLVELAGQGKVVVRLKGGDPFVFGRGGEEALGLAQAGVAFEVIPGVTAAVGATAYAGIPITHRGLTSTVALATGHEDPAKAVSPVDWSAVARMGTAAFYMSVRNLPTIVRQLMSGGLAAQTPAAVIAEGTRAHQRVITAPLAEIAERVAAADMRRPALMVVGAVVTLREHLAWAERRPLAGQTILVTRRRQQAAGLIETLTDMGAEVIACPVIEIASPQGSALAALDRAIAAAGSYDWLVFTSVNGVEGFVKRLDELGGDLRDLGQARLAAIGPATAAALRACHLRVDCLPAAYVAEAVFETLMAADQVRGRRFLLPRADIARPDLPRWLQEAGAAEVCHVDVYTTQSATTLPAQALTALREAVAAHCGPAAVVAQSAAALWEFGPSSPATVAAGGRAAPSPATWVTLTSSSTVRHFAELVRAAGGEELWRAVIAGCRFASIGPITAATAEQYGVPLHAQARQYTIPGLVKALCEAVAQGRRP